MTRLEVNIGHWLFEVNALEIKDFDTNLIFIHTTLDSKSKVPMKHLNRWLLILMGCEYICDRATARQVSDNVDSIFLMLVKVSCALMPPPY